jgi:hypothetical protein
MTAKPGVVPFGLLCGGAVLLAGLAALADDPPATPVAPGVPAVAIVAEQNKSNTVQGKIDEVTVYRGQALVTRLIEIPGDAGLHEIVVSDLPERIEPGSIYAESAEGVEVRSVRYRIRPVERDVRAEVRKLDDQIRQMQDQLHANETQEKVLADQTVYLGKLEQFTAPTANAELTKGVLNAETLKALTKFQFDMRGTIADQLLKLSLEKRDLNDRLAVLNRQREVVSGGSAKTIREAVVFVQSKIAGGKLRLRYLVDGATWDPSYNVRTDAKRQKVLVEYNASIEQMSGEDWTDVTMNLSTATPSLVAKAPMLEPLTIALSLGNPAQPATKSSTSAYFSAKKNLEEKRRQIELNRNLSGVGGGGGFGPAGVPQANAQPPMQQEAQGLNAPSQGQVAAMQTETYDATLNDVARESQVLDLVLTAKVDSSAKPSHNEPGEGVSVSYQLAGRTSLPSRSDRQLIQIAALPMKAEFYKVAIPVLTSAVYEEASVVNDGKLVLLNGPVATYVAGQFVGHGEVPTVAVGESFTIGLGIDSSLRAQRELLKKTESIQGGNRVVEFTYQLGVENFGAEPAQVRLMDRMPTAKESEVKLALVAPGQELSTDPQYQQRERKKGLLRWDVKVPAQAIGTKLTTVQYQMEMEYDKQLSIAGLPGKK